MGWTEEWWIDELAGDERMGEGRLWTTVMRLVRGVVGLEKWWWMDEEGRGACLGEEGGVLKVSEPGVMCCGGSVVER